MIFRFHFNGIWFLWFIFLMTFQSLADLFTWDHEIQDLDPYEQRRRILSWGTHPKVSPKSLGATCWSHQSKISPTPWKVPQMFHEQFMKEVFLLGGLGKFGVSSPGMWAKSLNQPHVSNRSFWFLLTLQKLSFSLNILIFRSDTVQDYQKLHWGGCFTVNNSSDSSVKPNEWWHCDLLSSCNRW